MAESLFDAAMWAQGRAGLERTRWPRNNSDATSSLRCHFVCSRMFLGLDPEEPRPLCKDRFLVGMAALSLHVEVWCEVCSRMETHAPAKALFCSIVDPMKLRKAAHRSDCVANVVAVAEVWLPLESWP